MHELREAAVDSEKAALTVNERLAFSIDELSMVTGICRDNLYDEVRAGRLKAKKLGKRTLVLKAAAQAFLEALPDLKLPTRDEVAVVAQIAEERRRRTPK